MIESSRQHAEDLLTKALNSFECRKEADIENFLRTKAIEFEKRGYCSVYLLLDKEAFSHGIISIQAYFTLSHKFISFSSNVSKTTKNKLSTNRTSTYTHFVLIGQLGKNIGANTPKDITAEIILNDAFSVIEKASDLIICRGVLVECNSNKKIHNLYKNYGFSYLQFDDKHYQFYKRIKSKQ